MLIKNSILFEKGKSDEEQYKEKESLTGIKDAAKSFESLKASGEASGLNIDVKENTLIYTYRYTDTYTGDTLAQMKATIEKTMKDTESTFENIADTFEEESGIDEVTVQLIYENGDGSQICKAEY